jgi:hypothetical protein
MKVVTLREPSTGRVFDREAERIAIELPTEWPDDASVVVTGDDLEWLRPDADRIVQRSVTRRLEQFFAGERCLASSKRVSDDGRSPWMVVEVVEAVHLGEPPQGPITAARSIACLQSLATAVATWLPRTPAPGGTKRNQKEQDSDRNLTEGLQVGAASRFSDSLLPGSIPVPPT